MPAVAADQLSVVGTVECRPPVAAPGQALFDHRRRRRRHRLHRPIALQILSVLPPLSFLVAGSRKLPTEAEPWSRENVAIRMEMRLSMGRVHFARCAFCQNI